jgi:hypothetical protein
MNPEKASLFNIHPERACSECCFFCRNKFGLFETPLHILQMKSLEIQKFASGYHKLRKDACLCNRCFRLLDQEAKKLKQESELEPEMASFDKKGTKKMTENEKLSHYIESNISLSAKMYEDQDLNISGRDARGEY